MNSNYKNPETIEELKTDLENHPERGKINGKDVVRFDLREFSGVVPHTLVDRALECGAPFGFTQDEILIAALTMWTSDPGIQQARASFQQELAEKHDVHARQIRSKIRGAYKKIKRIKRLNNLGDNYPESNKVNNVIS